jgi:hypothetical protein
LFLFCFWRLARSASAVLSRAVRQVFPILMHLSTLFLCADMTEGRGNLHGWLGEMPWIDSGHGQRHLRRKI